jgi:hypothetical protein
MSLSRRHSRTRLARRVLIVAVSASDVSCVVIIVDLFVLSGLQQVPQIVLDTAAITKLDLSLNAITSLPIAFCSVLLAEVY